MDPETLALYNAVEAGKITREDDKRRIQIAALVESIAEMRRAVQTGEAAIRNAQDILAELMTQWPK